MYNLESDEFVVGIIGGCDEEEGGVAAIDYFGIWMSRVRDLHGLCGEMGGGPLYSRKLHIRVLRASTS